jgi:hypothetical protein
MQAGDEIHAGICANAVGERGLFCQRYDTTALAPIFAASSWPLAG